MRCAGRLGSGGITEAQREVLSAVAARTPARAGVYVVGGLLRDRLAGRQTDDLDLVVRGVAPGVVAGWLARLPGFSRPVVFPRFKTVLVAGRGLRIEVCRLQGDLDRDAARRDFTVNALYADLRGLKGRAGLEVLDPTGLGLGDLRSKLIRTPADPYVTLWLDPLRMLRAVRFRAAMGFRLERDLVGAIGAMAYLIGRVSPERIRVELEKILVSRRLPAALGLLRRTGLLGLIVPELRATYDFDQATPHHAYDLFTHLVKTAGGTPPEVPLRLAGLLHDLGKTATASARPGRMVYYGHQEVSARQAAAIMERLRFSRRTTDLVAFLVGNHMINYSDDWSDKALRRLASRVGARLDNLLALAEADRRAQRPGAGAGTALASLRGRLDGLGEAGGLEPRPPLDGRQIMSVLGIAQGPLVGEAKAYLAERLLESGSPLSAARARDLLAAWYRERGGRPDEGSGTAV